MFSKDFREFVELLIKHKVDYPVVGGYAVGIHGHSRYTGDLLKNKRASNRSQDIADLDNLKE